MYVRVTCTRAFIVILCRDDLNLFTKQVFFARPGARMITCRGVLWSSHVPETMSSYTVKHRSLVLRGHSPRSFWSVNHGRPAESPASPSYLRNDRISASLWRCSTTSPLPRAHPLVLEAAPGVGIRAWLWAWGRLWAHAGARLHGWLQSSSSLDGTRDAIPIDSQGKLAPKCIRPPFDRALRFNSGSAAAAMHCPTASAEVAFRLPQLAGAVP